MEFTVNNRQSEPKKKVDLTLYDNFIIINEEVILILYARLNSVSWLVIIYILYFYAVLLSKLGDQIKLLKCLKYLCCIPKFGDLFYCNNIL